MFVYCFFFTPTFSSAIVLAREPLFDGLSAPKGEQLIVKVIASNIIVLENGRRIRLIGVNSLGNPEPHVTPINTDETFVPNEPRFDLEEQALLFAQQLLENKKVRLEYDVERRSPDGYDWAYVYLNDSDMANLILLKMGFVALSLSPPNLKYAKQMREAYQEARINKRGILSE